MHILGGIPLTATSHLGKSALRLLNEGRSLFSGDRGQANGMNHKSVGSDPLTARRHGSAFFHLVRKF